MHDMLLVASLSLTLLLGELPPDVHGRYFNPVHVDRMVLEHSPLARDAQNLQFEAEERTEDGERTWGVRQEPQGIYHPLCPDPCWPFS